MPKLKTIAFCMVVIGAGAYGLSMAAPQAGSEKQPSSDRGPRPEKAKSTAQPPLKLMAEYVVEPPDMLIVEVLEALPGRPISGERLVRPDGKITLGFYGDVYVAGLKLSEVKEKIIAQLQQHGIQDEALGLIAVDENGEIVVDPDTAAVKRIDPKNSDRVFVDVSAYNSKVYFVQGAFFVPGRMPITGNERVLDAVNFAGGLTQEANHNQAYLYREGPKEGPVETLKIDIDQITMGDDLSTNYQLQPGDRLVVGGGAGDRSGGKDRGTQPSDPSSRPRADINNRLGRPNPSANQPVKTGAEPAEAGEIKASLRHLEKRVAEMERKLDLILEAIKRPAD